MYICSIFLRLPAVFRRTTHFFHLLLHSYTFYLAVSRFRSPTPSLEIAVKFLISSYHFTSIRTLFIFTSARKCHFTDGYSLSAASSPFDKAFVAACLRTNTLCLLSKLALGICRSHSSSRWVLTYKINKIRSGQKLIMRLLCCSFFCPLYSKI